MVSPQAIEVFLPMITPGTEARLKPDTSNGQVPVMVRQCSPTWANTDGIDVARWGSLLRMACPLAVREPETTQELEPISPVSPATPRTGGKTSCTLSAARRAESAPSDRSRSSEAGSGLEEDRRASGSNSRSTTVPRPTISSLPSTGWVG